MNERVNYENCDYNGKIELKKDLELWTQLQLLQQGNKVSDSFFSFSAGQCPFKYLLYYDELLARDYDHYPLVLVKAILSFTTFPD